MSAAGRARIIAATKKRWAAFHKAKQKRGTVGHSSRKIPEERVELGRCSRVHRLRKIVLRRVVALREPLARSLVFGRIRGVLSGAATAMYITLSAARTPSELPTGTG